MSKIDLNIVWDDAREMARANRDLLTAIGGIFILMPLVVAIQFISVPEGMPDPKVNEEAFAAWYQSFMTANLPLLLGWTLVSSFGTLAMLILLLRQERPTVAESLKAALFILPSYCVAYILQNVAWQIGMILFVLPALYLTGRFALIAAVAAAEKEMNPITIIQRSFALTQGNGWRIFALLAIVTLAMGVLFIAGVLFTGVVTSLLLPADLAELLLHFVAGLMVTALMLAIVLVSAALYRAATAPVATPWRPDASF
ncbi:hypothetical protein [Sphingobium nicotianae]|uniref:Glycerophosphoryl diester phosphodiesterase membrane domain-containing protein n=1 Tax=Sphingobium nicotianae TaxID=2782607 RepID=A0A9X1DFE5_9SPHN|nr:hypothetical protein [Sphingobium nicotianae]MBT2188932.1 hypothetical protein [Sphingobium nicotianae]